MRDLDLVRLTIYVSFWFGAFLKAWARGLDHWGEKLTDTVLA